VSCCIYKSCATTPAAHLPVHAAEPSVLQPATEKSTPVALGTPTHPAAHAVHKHSVSFAAKFVAIDCCQHAGSHFVVCMFTQPILTSLGSRVLGHSSMQMHPLLTQRPVGTHSGVAEVPVLRSHLAVTPPAESAVKSALHLRPVEEATTVSNKHMPQTYPACILKLYAKHGHQSSWKHAVLPHQGVNSWPASVAFLLMPTTADAVACCEQCQAWNANALSNCSNACCDSACSHSTAGAEDQWPRLQNPSIERQITKSRAATSQEVHTRRMSVKQHCATPG
jgi:hypothetical protein